MNDEDDGERRLIPEGSGWLFGCVIGAWMWYALIAFVRWAFF